MVDSTGIKLEVQRKDIRRLHRQGGDRDPHEGPHHGSDRGSHRLARKAKRPANKAKEKRLLHPRKLQRPFG